MSVIDLLKDLRSDVHREWERLYKQEVARGNEAHQRLHEYRMRLITCEAQRACLINSLSHACRLLDEETQVYKSTVALMRKHIAEMETDYEALTIKPKGDPTPDQKPDTGSAVSQASVSVGTQDGASQGYCDLSPEIRQQLWDSTAPKAG